MQQQKDPNFRNFSGGRGQTQFRPQQNYRGGKMQGFQPQYYNNQESSEYNTMYMQQPNIRGGYMPQQMYPYNNMMEDNNYKPRMDGGNMGGNMGGHVTSNYRSEKYL